MKQGNFTVCSHESLTPLVRRMRLSGDVSAITAPGQFVNFAVEGQYLRRPISVYDSDDATFTVIYKIVGRGTERMAQAQTGDVFDVLTGLGNGYDTAPAGPAPLLIGGGVGVPPLYKLAKKLIAEGRRVSVILGFNTADEVFCEDEFRALGAAVTVTTADGSRGVRGFVTDAMPGLEYSYFYTCGPEPMLKAVWRATATGGQFSFEERMGCGFGACMGCSCRTVTGYKRICKDGPVLNKEEILWEK